MDEIRLVDLQAQYKALKSEIDRAIYSVIDSAAFVGGRYVREFEKLFRDYLGVRNCIGTGNGTDSLEIILDALSMHPRGNFDVMHCDVIVPALTFAATVEAVLRLGYDPIFCDMDIRTRNVSVDSILNSTTKDTGAVIAVHLYGEPCNMDGIFEVCRDNGTVVIEDCAQAHGASIRGRKVGTFGTASAFSFYPGKNLGAYGDAGAIVTDDDELACTCARLGNHGRLGKFDHELVGRNSRLDGIQAAILSAKLGALEKAVERRNRIAEMYIAALQDLPIGLPTIPVNAVHAWHLFVIEVEIDKRDSFIRHMKRESIQTGIHYPLPLNRMPTYRYLGQENDCPNALWIAERAVSIPVHEYLTDGQVEYIIETIRGFYG